ncbi:MAG: hypothetical protein ACU84Q_07355, partial [Gammaproteobacteria bacterium]
DISKFFSHLGSTVRVLAKCLNTTVRIGSIGSGSGIAAQKGRHYNELVLKVLLITAKICCISDQHPDL